MRRPRGAASHRRCRPRRGRRPGRSRRRSPRARCRRRPRASPARADRVERGRELAQRRRPHRDATAMGPRRAARVRRRASAPSTRRRARRRRRPGSPRAGRGCGRRPTAMARRPVQRASHARTGRRSVDEPLGRSPGSGWHRRVTCTSTPMRAERADQQPGQVEAADVLDRRSPALHQPSVGGDEAHLQHPVAERPVPEAAVAGQPGRRARRRRWRPPSRGSSARLLALGAEHRRQLVAAGARADGDGEVGGVVGDDAGGRVHHGTSSPVGAGPPTSQWVRLPTAATVPARGHRLAAARRPR